MKHLTHDDLIIKNKFGNTQLHYVCYNRHLEIVKELLPRLNYEDLIIQNTFGNTPLHHACIEGHLEIVKELLRQLNHEELNKKNKNGCRPLMYACLHDHLKIIKVLILNGSPIVDYPQYNACMKSIKWSKKEHKYVMHIQTRQNMQFIFMMYRHTMLEKL